MKKVVKTVEVKNVTIVPGHSLHSHWSKDMQKIFTDQGTFIDKMPINTGHDWKNEIGKHISVQIKNSTGYEWIEPYQNDNNTEEWEEYEDNTPDKETLPSDYNLADNVELEKAYDYIKQNCPVVFLTGGAGTGKSTFIKYLKNNLKKDTGKNYIVLAPTGVAAINVGGQTIHSFFGFKEDIFENEEINKLPKNPVIDHTALIIIDEISMVSSWMLDHIDYALRLWCDKGKPFGGKQILLIGDCFQLPPVIDDDEAKQQFIAKWASPFFFSAKVFENEEVLLKAIQLKKIYRQKNDIPFMHMLNRIRKGQNGFEKDIDFLNEKCFVEARLGTKNIPEECLFLTTKNADADKYNILKLHNLKEKGDAIKSYKGEKWRIFDFDHFLTPETLELCKGAKIMVTKNIKSQGLVNGDMGKVVDLGEDYVDVEIKGQKYQLNRETWQSFKYQWDEENEKIKQIPEGSFTQIPLRLGWAVTIHKSQGLTLETVAIDAEDAWDSGQVYVALSRSKSMNGIILRKKIPITAVKANPYIKRIYEQWFPDEKDEVTNIDDYKKITFDNTIFTIDKAEEITSVLIGGKRFELFPSEGEKIQDYVKRTLPVLINDNLIPSEELQRLLTEKDYCYNTFGIYANNNAKDHYTLLRRNKDYYYDSYNNMYRCWKDCYCGYYICSQWYPDCASKYAEWLIKLSKMA